MKRFFAVALVILLFFTGAVYADMPPELPVLSEDSYSIGTALPVTEILIGDEVYVNVTVENAVNARAFEIVTEYEHDFLEYKSVAVDTADVSPVKVEHNTDGTLMFAFTTVKDEIINSADKLCTINFTALKNGEATVSLKSVKLVFDDMRYISYTDLDKSIRLTLGKEEVKKPLGGGGGGGGGGFYVKNPTKDADEEADKQDDKQADTKSDDDSGNTPAEREKEFALPEESVKFNDLTEDFWGYDYIIALVERGVINGYEDGSFKPDAPITRAEFAKMLVTAAGLNTEGTVGKIFFDVAMSDWYAEFVNTAAEHNIFNGDESGCFNPNQCITREDAATALARYIDAFDIEIEESRAAARFADYDMISGYAKEHIERLYMLGIVNGSGDNKFYPRSNITRAEAAAMIYRLC